MAKQPKKPVPVIDTPPTLTRKGREALGVQADVPKLMRKVQRTAPGWPRVHLRLSETGTFYADLMRTRDQAREAVIAGYVKRGHSPAVDELAADMDAAFERPALTAEGKTAGDALAALLVRMKEGR